MNPFINLNTMKKSIIVAALAVATIFSANNADAQIKMPPASSGQTITQGLGISKATLTYNRPNMNGRKIFGGLVPLGEVWRTGANTVSALTTETSLQIAGHELPAGTYGILTIPGENEWTVIFSNNSKQWGAYSYKQEEDVFRFTVNPERLNQPVETFTMGFANVGPESAVFEILWENTKVSFPIAYNQSKEILASIDEVMAGTGNKPYMAAAQYYYNNGHDINKAVSWINEAAKASEAPHILYWQARILLKSGDKAGAVAAAQKGVEAATKANNSEYINLNSQVLAEAQR